MNTGTQEAQETKKVQGQELYIQGKLAMNAGNYEDMKKFFDQAVALGNSSAMNDFAFYHQYLTVGAPQCEQVIKYYLMAIDAGNINSCYNLGCFYHEQGDRENEVRYFTLASEKGDARAHFGLGMYYEGKKDLDVSYKFYKLATTADTAVAANQGLVAKAHTALGDCCKRQGKFLEAKDEYLQALHGGDRDAYYALDDRRIILSSEERKEMFTFVRKIYFPESLEPGYQPATVKQETKSFVDENGKEVSYLSFTIGHDK